MLKIMGKKIFQIYADYDDNQSSVIFKQHAEASILLSVLQGSPVQAMEHVTYT